MAKYVKVKRYRNIYSRRKFSWAKLVLLLLTAAALAFTGASLYAPIRDFVTGKLTAEPDGSQSSSVSETSSPSEMSSSGEDPESKPEREPEAEPEPEMVFSFDGMRAVIVPREVLLSGKTAEYVKGIPLEGINAVVLELKGTDGTVLFQTEQELAAGSLDERAVDLPQTVLALKNAGYSVVARIAAYRDPLASLIEEGLYAVKYRNTDYKWLDNNPELGGKPWLNPYAPQAQEYIRGLALEAAAAGADAILLENVQFPEGVGTESVSYGEWGKTVERDDLLRSFVSDLRAQLEKQNTALICSVPVTALLSDGESRYGGANPAELFGEPLSLSGLNETSYEMAEDALEKVKPSASGTFAAMIQGGDQVLEKEWMHFLKNCGINSYIIRYDQEQR